MTLGLLLRRLPLDRPVGDATQLWIALGDDRATRAERPEGSHINAAAYRCLEPICRLPACGRAQTSRTIRPIMKKPIIIVSADQFHHACIYRNEQRHRTDLLIANLIALPVHMCHLHWRLASVEVMQRGGVLDTMPMRRNVVTNAFWPRACTTQKGLLSYTPDKGGSTGTRCDADEPKEGADYFLSRAVIT